MSTVTLFTADELLHRPKDGFRYELIRGELHQMSPAGFEHGQISARIVIHLGQFVEYHQLGTIVSAEPGFKLESNPDTVLAPDVAYVSHQRVSQITNPLAFADISPDLAIEVMSPSDSPAKLARKCETWLEAGSLAAVLVNPRQQTATVYQPGRMPVELTVTDILTVPEVVPGWEMPIRRMFALKR